MRPTTSCARCVRDLTPGCEHLGNTWDNLALKTYGRTELTPDEQGQFEQGLIVYALNRMLALDRDNGNKAQGKPAKRIYKSRNTMSAISLANKCQYTNPIGLRCMRNPHPDEPNRHKF